MPLIIGDQPLTLADIRQALAGPITVKLSAAALKAIALGRETVIAGCCQQGSPIYGVNTGFGKLASHADRRLPISLPCRSISCARTQPASALRCPQP